jgi:hypothetical protein
MVATGRIFSKLESLANTQHFLAGKHVFMPKFNDINWRLILAARNFLSQSSIEEYAKQLTRSCSIGEWEPKEWRE